MTSVHLPVVRSNDHRKILPIVLSRVSATHSAVVDSNSKSTILRNVSVDVSIPGRKVEARLLMQHDGNVSAYPSTALPT
jgi:hypothetical protein